MSISTNIRISDDAEFPTVAGEAAGDPLLVDLVRLADTLNVEHGIALTMGGSLITATLFSAHRFFEAQAKAAAAGTVSGGAGDAAALDYQRHMVEFYTARMRLYDPGRISTADSKYRPRFIHLHNARWIGNDGMFTGETPLWRGRIDAVDGFAIRQV